MIQCVINPPLHIAGNQSVSVCKADSSLVIDLQKAYVTDRCLLSDATTLNSPTSPLPLYLISTPLHTCPLATLTVHTPARTSTPGEECRKDRCWCRHGLSMTGRRRQAASPSTGRRCRSFQPTGRAAGQVTGTAVLPLAARHPPACRPPARRPPPRAQNPPDDHRSVTLFVLVTPLATAVSESYTVTETAPEISA